MTTDTHTTAPASPEAIKRSRAKAALRDDFAKLGEREQVIVLELARALDRSREARA